MANKRVIKGYAKNTGKYVLKNVAKALGLDLVGTGFIVSSLSKSHIVKGIGTLAATIACPAAMVCVAEAVIAKKLLEGVVTDKDPIEGITNDLRKSTELTGNILHEIGKGIGDTGHFINREAERL
jgi:hypothetical protein